MTTSTLEIRSEQRAFHWVAWVARPGEASPANGLLMVGRTQEEAEARIREWAATGNPGY